MKKNRPYILACSGGPDSVFLAHLLKKYNFKNVLLAHVNYGLRIDSDYDQSIVEKTAKELNYSVKTLKVLDSNKYKNIQSEARDARFKYFKNLNYSNHIFLAHQKNDQIESIEMHKMFKHKYKVVGIKPVSKNFFYDLVYLRPILNLKKAKIINFLNKNNIPYAIDSSNAENNYLRNKIRNNTNYTFWKIFKLYLYKYFKNAINQKTYINKEKFISNNQLMINKKTCKLKVINYFLLKNGINQTTSKNLQSIIDYMKSEKYYKFFTLPNGNKLEKKKTNGINYLLIIKK